MYFFAGSFERKMQALRHLTHKYAYAVSEREDVFCVSTVTFAQIRN